MPLTIRFNPASSTTLPLKLAKPQPSSKRGDIAFDSSEKHSQAEWNKMQNQLYGRTESPITEWVKKLAQRQEGKIREQQIAEEKQIEGKKQIAEFKNLLGMSRKSSVEDFYSTSKSRHERELQAQIKSSKKVGHFFGEELEELQAKAIPMWRLSFNAVQNFLGNPSKRSTKA